jgi:hypothetical protein
MFYIQTLHIQPRTLYNIDNVKIDDRANLNGRFNRYLCLIKE